MVTRDEEMERVLRDLTLQRTQAVRLAKAGHELFSEIVAAVSETMKSDGSGDVTEFSRRLNEALTKFAPRDFEIKRLLENEGL